MEAQGRIRRERILLVIYLQSSGIAASKLNLWDEATPHAQYTYYIWE
jgi:hypothetical protein